MPIVRVDISSKKLIIVTIKNYRHCQGFSKKYYDVTYLTYPQPFKISCTAAEYRFKVDPTFQFVIFDTFFLKLNSNEFDKFNYTYN